MKNFFQKNAIFLAALLQVLPVVRNTIVNPATTNSFAIIMRWGIGSTAAFGAYDAISASSTPYFFPFQTNIVMTVGVYYTNSIVVTNTGTDPGAYFELTNSLGQDSGQIGGNSTTTVCLPPGITLKCVDKVVNHSVYAAVYGTPTTVGTTGKVSVDAGFSGAGDIYTNVFFTVISGASLPTITNQPANASIVAGGTTNFTVLAGTAPLKYQWYFNTNTVLPNATNTSLTLTNILKSQAGTYSVIITNTAGSVTSTPAILMVATPPSPPITSSSISASGGFFHITFNPIAGLTNAVQTNSNLAAGIWSTMTNIPPPVTTNAVTVTDAVNSAGKFYRVQINP
ncbi:MAG TPA: immunoglobulin domain-containing protein [Verrucomicrobiae bacterium]|nr:immunoglobulin domain-containing protein [Verrucomicrobiae bacterium]